MPVGAASVCAMTVACDQSIDSAAPPELVWQLVSTSEGLSGWFVNATVAGGPQGAVTLRFAPGAEATVPVLAWEPQRRIRFGVADGGRVHDIAITPVAVAAVSWCTTRGSPTPSATPPRQAGQASWRGCVTWQRADGSVRAYPVVVEQSLTTTG